jgi:hypothetical protein
MHETAELAVMCNTFHPLKLSKFAKALDDRKYAYSWYENALDVAGAEAPVDGDASGLGSPRTSGWMGYGAVASSRLSWTI